MATATIECVRSHLKSYLATKDQLLHWLGERAPSRFEPFYSSIDIRDAGFKLAPVDANLYPAGFNNICSEDLEHSTELLKPLLKRHLGFLPKRVAILPELHTRNHFYVDNLYELRQLFRRIGIETEIGWLPEDTQSSKDPVELQTTDERKVLAHPFSRKEDKLVFAPFEPEFILLNNDFSSGLPEILKRLSQPIEPSPKMGWHSRKKSDFFVHYNKLAGELAEAAGCDAWHVQVTTQLVEGVDFQAHLGMDRIARAVDATLEQMRSEYAKRNIQEEPFVFVKNNAGTYGMGILRVQSGKELLELNRRERNKMAVGKNQLQVHDVIVQEGIPTRFQLDGVYSEPVIYLLGHDLLGGFLRKNPSRGKVDNLNSRGMVFQKLCIADLKHGADRDLELEMVYGTIAQLSASAISLEIEGVEGLSSRS
ncbi:MAG: glutamate--cysteine ligase [Bdellovibrionota bacterium]